MDYFKFIVNLDGKIELANEALEKLSENATEELVLRHQDELKLIFDKLVADAYRELNTAIKQMEVSK